MLQVRLPAEFLVRNEPRDMSEWARGNCELLVGKRAGSVVLCPCFDEVHKDILLCGKHCPMFSYSL